MKSASLAHFFDWTIKTAELPTRSPLFRAQRLLSQHGRRARSPGCNIKSPRARVSTPRTRTLSSRIITSRPPPDETKRNDRKPSLPPIPRPPTVEHADRLPEHAVPGPTRGRHGTHPARPRVHRLSHPQARRARHPQGGPPPGDRQVARGGMENWGATTVPTPDSKSARLPGGHQPAVREARARRDGAATTSPTRSGPSSYGTSTARTPFPTS